MERPFSKSHQERLGERLIASAVPDDEDLAALRELLTFYGAILESASDRLRSELGLQTTSRVKNTGTILEKLRRSGGSTLKSMQDLAGMRIVGGPDRREQDETVERVVALFQGENRVPKVIDRRANPVHGYSAVHVIVFPEGVPVEVQIRTTWQHEWAEVFEKLADQIGRGIRYGEPPEPVEFPTFPALPHLDSEVQEIETELRDFERGERDSRDRIVQHALGLAGAIDAYEQASSVSPPDTSIRNAIAEILTNLQAWIDSTHRINHHAEKIASAIALLRARSDEGP